MSRDAGLIRVENVSIRFGGVQALSDISFAIPSRSTFGIIGPNGAGKTTLFNCVSGFLQPERGSRVIYDGQDLVGRRVDQIARLGIARTFQNILLVKKLSVRENILAGMHLSIDYSPIAALLPLPRVRREEDRAASRVQEVADILGFSRQVLEAPVDTLPLGMQKKVEVARAIARRPRVLMVDEPAGGLNDGETRDLSDSLRRVKDAEDLTVVLIDHDMSLVMALCDRLCVLNFGQKIAEGTPAEIAANQDVIDCYLGVSDDA